MSTLEHLQEPQTCLNEYCESNLEEEGVVTSDRQRTMPDFGGSSQFPVTLVSQVGGVEHSPIEGKFFFLLLFVILIVLC